MTLTDYVLVNTVRGECQCGRCIDKGNAPDPAHGIDTGFFKVGLAPGQTPSREEFETLVREHRGEFSDIKPLAHGIYTFIEMGAWIGDQGLAMQCMALGKMLGSWELIAAPNRGCFIYIKGTT